MHEVGCLPFSLGYWILPLNIFYQLRSHVSRSLTDVFQFRFFDNVKEKKMLGWICWVEKNEIRVASDLTALREYSHVNCPNHLILTMLGSVRIVPSSCRIMSFHLRSVHLTILKKQTYDF